MTIIWCAEMALWHDLCNKSLPRIVTVTAARCRRFLSSAATVLSFSSLLITGNGGRYDAIQTTYNGKAYGHTEDGAVSPAVPI